MKCSFNVSGSGETMITKPRIYRDASATDLSDHKPSTYDLNIAGNTCEGNRKQATNT